MMGFVDFRELLDRVLDYATPPVCSTCDIDVDGDRPLCYVCNKKWQSEKQLLCSTCGLPHCKCECMIKVVSPMLEPKIITVCHLGPYRPGTYELVGNLMAYKMKDSNYARLYRFVGFELADRILQSFVPDDNTIVTYIPRTSKKVRETGIDQGKMISKYVAIRMGVPHVAALKNVSRKTQKELGNLERVVNARSAYRIRPKRIPEIEGKTVILIDDIITTGASMLAVSELLLEYGAQRFLIASMLRTQR